MPKLKGLLTAAAAAVCFAAPQGASAWGEPGHQVIGSIAWAILNQPGHDNARQHVQAILNSIGNHTLAEAATWADCVRDVGKSNSGFGVSYVKGKTPQICMDAFPENDQTETAAMITYVQNNWSQCDYTRPGGGQCDLTFHFEDIPYQHGGYTPTELSTSKHDALSAIGEAIYYLQNGQDSAGSMVVYSSPREALFVLAHLVGDIHQPLHVGAVYLDAQGGVVDPGADTALAKQTFTTGGNFIYDAASRSSKPPELHGEWDKIPANLGTSASNALVADAQSKVAADTGDLTQWPASWASESVALARDKAFAGLTFSGHGPGKWIFTAPQGYVRLRANVQKLQLERAGVRLAELLEAIWPG